MRISGSTTSSSATAISTCSTVYTRAITTIRAIICTSASASASAVSAASTASTYTKWSRSSASSTSSIVYRASIASIPTCVFERSYSRSSQSTGTPSKLASTATTRRCDDEPTAAPQTGRESVGRTVEMQSISRVFALSQSWDVLVEKRGRQVG